MRKEHGVIGWSACWHLRASRTEVYAGREARGTPCRRSSQISGYMHQVGPEIGGGVLIRHFLVEFHRNKGDASKVDLHFGPLAAGRLV